MGRKREVKVKNALRNKKNDFFIAEQTFGTQAPSVNVRRVMSFNKDW